MIEAWRVRFGLDKPIHIQYWHWMVGQKDSDTGEIMGGVLRGDLGFSQIGASSVASVLTMLVTAPLTDVTVVEPG